MFEERDMRAIYESRKSFESMNDLEAHVRKTFGELDFLYDCKAIAAAISQEKEGGYVIVADFDEFKRVSQQN